MEKFDSTTCMYENDFARENARLLAAGTEPSLLDYTSSMLTLASSRGKKNRSTYVIAIVCAGIRIASSSSTLGSTTVFTDN
jgi:hypothetical protein